MTFSPRRSIISTVRPTVASIDVEGVGRALACVAIGRLEEWRRVCFCFSLQAGRRRGPQYLTDETVHIFRGFRFGRRTFEYSAALVTTLLALALMLGAAHADPAAPDPNAPVFQPAINAQVKLFVVALLLESGLAVIFNWRVYLALVDGRGWKTLIMIAASWLLVKVVPITWVADLLDSYGGTIKPDELIAQILTTLILAGGSSGINNLLVALGYRSAPSAETVQPKPAPDMAWIAVKVKRAKAVGRIEVRLQKVANPPPNPLPFPIVGIVGGGSWLEELSGLFFRNRMRFPRSGGYDVEPGAGYDLQIIANGAGGRIASPIDGTYVFARGAIVDMSVTL